MIATNQPTNQLGVKSDTAIISQMDDHVGRLIQVRDAASITVRSPTTITATNRTPSKRKRINYHQSTTIEEEETQQLQQVPPTNERPIIGGAVNMDEDEPMNEVLEAPKVVNMNPIATSLGRHLTYGDVMVEPCMMRMLEFTSIHDRIRSLTVSRHWWYMIRLPRLWSNVRLNLQYSDSSDTDRMPRWLLSSIGRLSLRDGPSGVMILKQFSRIHHLLLVFNTYSTKHVVAEISVPLLRSALQALHLVSFGCRYLPPPMMQSLFESQPPPIHCWTNTLTHLEVDVDHEESIHPTLVSISQYVWPQLISFKMRMIGLSTVPVITNLLTRTRLPLLQCLSYLLSFSRNVNGDLSEPAQLFDPLFVSVQQEFYQLTTLTSDLDLSELTHELKFYQVYHFSPGLTNLHLHFNDIHVYPYIGSLQHLQTLTLTCCHLGPLILSHLFLTTIGHHNLPQLHTLRITSFEHEEDHNINDSGQHGDEVIRMMKAMVNLVSLEIELNWRRSDIRSYWLESIHYFPHLTELTCSVEKVSCLGLYESIGVAPKLEIVSLKIPPTDLGHLIQAWSRCSSNLLTSSSLSHLIPIRQFRVSMPFQPSPYPRVSFSADHIIQLQCLSQLTELSLRGPIEPHTPAMKVLADLPHLRSLCLYGYVYCYSLDVFLYWSQPSPFKRFPQLTTLRMSHYTDNRTWLTQNSLSHMVLIEFLIRLSHLHTLSIAGLNLSNELADVRAFIQQVNHLGRQPPLELDLDGRVGRFTMHLIDRE